MGILSYNFKISIGDISEKTTLTNTGFQRLMQEAAVMASNSIGYGPYTISETRIFWVLLNWKLQVFERPKWNDTITIKTWPRGMTKCYSARELEAFDQNGKRIAIASSRWVLINLDKGITKISKELEEQYGSVDIPLFNEPLDKILEPETPEYSIELVAQRRDIDTNRHVNNIAYLHYAYETLPKAIYEKIDFNNVEIMYKHEAKVGSKIICSYKKLETGEHVVTIKSKEDNKIHAIVKLM